MLFAIIVKRIEDGDRPFRSSTLATVDAPFPVATLLLGVVFGLVAGMAYVIAKRAWSDYGKAKAGLPGMRRTAWTLTRIATTRIGIVVLVCVAAVAYAVVDG
nr:hypothetical protein [Micromonospora sp. DSM 115978]